MNLEDLESKPVPAMSTPRSGWIDSLPWLFLAALLLLVSNGRNTIAVAAWLAPIYLVRFVRSRALLPGLSTAGIVLVGAWMFQFRGMVPVPRIWFFVIAAVYGLVGLVPFAVDRIVAPRLRGFPTTFVLPAAWVVTEYLMASFTPYGSWGSIAYSQYEHLALLQIISVTGLYGVTFLIAWFAAVVNWVWEQRFSWPQVRKGVLVFSAIAVATLIGGGARLSWFAPDAPTVRVASVTRPDIALISDPETRRRAMNGSLTDEESAEIRERTDLINGDLLQRSEREAIAGAKIVFWGESNAFTFKENEDELLGRAAAVARARGIYLGVGVGTWNSEADKPLENKLILIDPDGEKVWENWKKIPVPGGEAAISARDDGRIKSAETPYGQIGAVVCFDMDFPGLLHQAGDLDVDIMLVPSNDWREIDPWHTHMARFRAIEQGFNLVRHTSGGLSVATDYQGRILSMMDHYVTDDRSLISHVPIEGVRTIYARFGDTFSWLCLIALIVLTIRAWRARPESNHA